MAKGLSADPETLITQLRDILENYHEDDIVRELLQNADDARASRLYFYVITQGSANSCHPLLALPGLIVFNDGALKDSDVGAITKLIGGNKSTDEAKVGRFGLGLKSIFHICDAMFFDSYRGKQADYKIRGALFDPYCDVRTNPEYHGYLEQWAPDQEERAIREINKALAKALPDDIRDGFFMFVPARDCRNGMLRLKTATSRALSLSGCLRIR